MAPYKKEKDSSPTNTSTQTDLYEKPNNGKGFHLSVKAKCKQGTGNCGGGGGSLIITGKQERHLIKNIRRLQVKKIADRIQYV